jgi:hypothetical protein
MTETDSDDRKILSPFDKRECICLKDAATIADKSESTLRAWCEKHGLGRRIGGGTWSVSRIALAMFLDGDKKALQAYHSGDRTGAIVKAYFGRVGLAEFGRYQEQIQMIATAIGKPTANVLTNVRANSESQFGSGRICSNDMRLAPSLQIEKGVRKTTAFLTSARKVAHSPRAD